MNDASPQSWEVWHARFNYEGGKGYKYRPVIVVGVCEDSSLVMMVAGSANALRMEHDYLLRDWGAAGLVKPSIARIDRIAKIPAGYLGAAGKIGELSAHDRDAIARALAALDTVRSGHEA